MKCSNCGNEVDSNAKFCNRCGAPITPPASPANSGKFVWNDRYTVIAIIAAMCVAAVIGLAVRKSKDSAKTEERYADNTQISETVGEHEAPSEERLEEQLEELPERPLEEQPQEQPEEWTEEGTKEQAAETVMTETAMTEAAAKQPGEERDYFLEGSDSRYIDRSEIEGFTADECRIARNEIYARHGRKFKDQTLQQYFESFDWYQPTIEPDAFSESLLNAFEIANRNMIVEYENEKGYR